MASRKTTWSRTRARSRNTRPSTWRDLRGDYALISIGAVANWHVFPAMGNLLWNLQPREDLGGASVASKVHVVCSPAATTGCALGIKLIVPPPVIHHL